MLPTLLNTSPMIIQKRLCCVFLFFFIRLNYLLFSSSFLIETFSFNRPLKCFPTPEYLKCPFCKAFISHLVIPRHVLSCRYSRIEAGNRETLHNVSSTTSNSQLPDISQMFSTQSNNTHSFQSAASSDSLPAQNSDVQDENVSLDAQSSLNQFDTLFFCL